MRKEFFHYFPVNVFLLYMTSWVQWIKILRITYISFGIHESQLNLFYLQYIVLNLVFTLCFLVCCCRSELTRFLTGNNDTVGMSTDTSSSLLHLIREVVDSFECVLTVHRLIFILWKQNIISKITMLSLDNHQYNLYKNITSFSEGGISMAMMLTRAFLC